MWGNAGSGGSRTASLGDALASCAAHASEKKKQVPTCPCWPMPTGPRQGTGYEPVLSGTGPQGVQPLLEFRTHVPTLLLAPKRGVHPWIPWNQPEPRGSCPIAFGKSDTPWGYPTGCLRLSSFGTTIMCAPGAERRPFAGSGGSRNGSCSCADTAHATSFRFRPVWRTGFSLSRPWIRVAGSMHPVLR